MFRTKNLGTVLILLALVVGASYLFYVNASAQDQEVTDQTVRTTRVRQGDLVISTSGSGELIPADDVSLGFTSGGVVAKVLVEVGDRVNAGEILAHLDDLNARQALIAAQLQVAQAEDTLARETDVEAADREVALAEAKLAQAQFNLDELLNWAPDAQAVEQAQANLEAAKASYEAAISKSAYDQTTSARVSLEQAQKSLEDAQEAFDTAWDPARDWELYDPRHSTKLENERESATRNLERAGQNLEVAQANYNLAWAGIDDTSELNARTQVLNAQAALEELQTGPDEADILAAQIQVLQAEAELATVRANQVSDPKLARLTLEQAQLNLEAAQQAFRPCFEQLEQVQ